MATILSFPFDSQTLPDGTKDRTFTAREFSMPTREMFYSGVSADANALKVEVESGITLRVRSGYALMDGHSFNLDDSDGEPYTISVSPASQDRIDRVVLHLDWLQERTITVMLKQGVGGVNAPPALVRSGSVWEMSLAQVIIRAGSDEIAEGDIIDERDDYSVCGRIHFRMTAGSIPEGVFIQYPDYTRAPGFAIATLIDDVYSISLNPPPAAMAMGLGVRVKLQNNSPANPKLDVNGLGAVAIHRNRSEALAADSLHAQDVYSFTYDGERWILSGEGPKGENGKDALEPILVESQAAWEAIAYKEQRFYVW